MAEQKRSVLQEVLSYLASAAVSTLVVVATASLLDPNRGTHRAQAERRKALAQRLGRPNLNLTPYEEAVAQDVVNPSDIEETFDSIGGLEDVKAELRHIVILPLDRPELFEGRLLRQQKGVLLFGPPGTGKTLLAKAVAKEANATFINVRVANLMSKWFGDAQKLVSALFSLAQKLQPAIIFVDEVDSFLGQRGGSMSEHEALSTMKTEFMAQWDGFATNKKSRVLVLCGTNRPGDLDEAILRRLPRHFFVGLPDAKARAQILRVFLKGEKAGEDLDVDEIANRCEGLSGSDLEEVCQQAAMRTVRDFLEAERNAQLNRNGNGNGNGKLKQHGMEDIEKPTERRAICQDDFLEVLEVFSSTQEAAIRYQRQWKVGR